MNDLLQLKGRFEKRDNQSGFGAIKLPSKKSVESIHMMELINQLKSAKAFWESEKTIGGALISVHYIRVVAKSNRLKYLLGERGKKPVDSIRGAKFSMSKNVDGSIKHKHIFTHYVQISAIEKAIQSLEVAMSIVASEFNGCITAEDTEKIGKDIPYKYKDIMAISNFLNIIVDCYFVEKFNVDMDTEKVTEDEIVTIYKTDIDTKHLLSQFGIDVIENRIIDGTTLLLTPPQIELLKEKAPYLIAMSVTDFSKISLDDGIMKDDMFFDEEKIIPPPTSEPIIGVIDTQFDERVYFHDWVDYKPMLRKEIELEKVDFYHGTAVSSIIVDGPRGNPNLDDGCGRFRVRHFGVSKQRGFSSFSVLKEIRTIVSNNQDIKVWNLSLGSPNQIKENFISPEAAELDRIQNEFDVIFIVAGTNTPDGYSHPDMYIGSPADSLNSLVVNAVNMRGKSASYTRKGPVLSFFHKPDISYYGGDGVKPEEKISVCIDDMGETWRTGTSFAAPWITRKMAYLIYIMGLSREVAKALIIDSAAGWKANGTVSDTIGYGVVPKHINDILNTSDDEIKFIITGTAEDYETYNYKIPVPVVEGKHPFYARAVLVYFPHCDRNQGVDYTSTEMDLRFGRVQTTGEKTKIHPINNNVQSEDGEYMYEESARNIFRKWDNVKRLCEQIKERRVPKKTYDAGLWGIGIFTKERITANDRRSMPFGVVITLKEMYGKNRIDDFIQMCMAKGWIVNRLEIQNQIDIYVKAEENIEFE